MESPYNPRQLIAIPNPERRRPVRQEHRSQEPRRFQRRRFDRFRTKADIARRKMENKAIDALEWSGQKSQKLIDGFLYSVIRFLLFLRRKVSHKYYNIIDSIVEKIYKLRSSITEKSPEVLRREDGMFTAIDNMASSAKSVTRAVDEILS